MDYNFENVNLEVLREMSEDVFDDNGQNRVWHDDGAMGIVYQGNSYVFYIGQDVSRSQYNSEANRILRLVGVVGPRVVGENN